MPIEHNEITDPELHEPKGVAAAAAGTVYVADGAGSGDWTSKEVAYAQGYISGNSTATTIATVDTPTVVDFNGGFNSVLAEDFTVSVEGVLTYTGTPSIVAKIDAIVYMTAAAASKVFLFKLAKNDTAIASSLSKRNDEGQASVSTVVALATNDTIKLFVENTTDDTDLTVTEASINAVQVGF